MNKLCSVQNLTNIIAVADVYNQVQFVCLWGCAPSDFVFQINNFVSLVLFSAVIHWKGKKRLISKTIKYKLDSSSKMQFSSWFYPILKTIKNFVENYPLGEERGGRVPTGVENMGGGSSKFDGEGGGT